MIDWLISILLSVFQQCEHDQNFKFDTKTKTIEFETNTETETKLFKMRQRRMMSAYNNKNNNVVRIINNALRFLKMADKK